MHITFILQDMYRLGAQYVTAMIANGLSDRGHQVDVVVSAVELKIRKERPDLFPFPLNDSIKKIILSNVKSSRNILEIRKYIKQYRPDIIIPMTPTYVLPTALALKILSIKTKLIPVEHSGGIGLNLKKANKKKILISVISKIGYSLLADRINGIIAVSEGVKTALRHTKTAKRENVQVIYNPVISELFYEKIKKQATHSWLIHKEIPVLVAAGAHVPIKGYDFLIKAMVEVNKKTPCRLILFGEGMLTNDLKKLSIELNIGELVSFPGYTTNLPAELKNADAFVVSSHAESFSIVLVEALAAGIPVIATNCPSGPPEILHNGKYGIMAKVGNPDSIAQGILKVLNGKGIIPPKESWDPYLMEEIAVRYETFFFKIIQKSEID